MELRCTLLGAHHGKLVANIELLEAKIALIITAIWTIYDQNVFRLLITFRLVAKLL